MSLDPRGQMSTKKSSTERDARSVPVTDKKSSSEATSAADIASTTETLTSLSTVSILSADRRLDNGTRAAEDSTDSVLVVEDSTDINILVDGSADGVTTVDGSADGVTTVDGSGGITVAVKDLEASTSI